MVAGGRGLAGCGHLLVSLLGLLLLLARSGTRALVCLPCDALMYSFSYLEPVHCSMSNFNCCFLTCI